jgi:hypothetical protein
MADIFKTIDPVSGGGGGGTPYTQTFTAGSFSGPSGGEYSITTLQSTHDKGTSPIVQVYEKIGSNFFEISVSIEVNPSGDVIIAVNEVPDLRFEGKIVIQGSSVTDTELGYLDATSSVQTQLDAKVDDSEKGAANGVATLDGTGKLPSAQLPASAMEYKGAWAASTNTPSLANGSGTNGDMYKASDAGTVDFGAGNISFVAGDAVIYNGSIYEKIPGSDLIDSVFGRTGAVVAVAGDYTASEVTNVAAGNIAAVTVQAAIDELDSEKQADVITTQGDTIIGSAGGAAERLALGTNGQVLQSNGTTAACTNTANPIEISTLNDGADEDLQIQFDVAKVDHDSTLNFVANEHIDHSSVDITTAADSGLSGGGDLTASRTLVVDIDGTTAETSADDADTILIFDDSASARKKMTRANFLSGVAVNSAGDIDETSFSAANNQAAAANVTGLAFANGTVRSFRAQVSIVIDATADLYEVFILEGIQKGAAWDMSISATGDDSNIVFTITSAGQVQYTSGNEAGFVSSTMKFRAETTSV